jgi:hypothetical protein
MSFGQQETIAGRPLWVRRIESKDSEEEHCEDFDQRQLSAEMTGVCAGVYSQIEEVLPELAAEPRERVEIRRNLNTAWL